MAYVYKGARVCHHLTPVINTMLHADAYAQDLRRQADHVLSVASP